MEGHLGGGLNRGGKIIFVIVVAVIILPIYILAEATLNLCRYCWEQ